MGPLSSTDSSAARVAAPSVMSKHTRLAAPPRLDLGDEGPGGFPAAVGMHVHVVPVTRQAPAQRPAMPPLPPVTSAAAAAHARIPCTIRAAKAASITMLARPWRSERASRLPSAELIEYRARIPGHALGGGDQIAA